MENIRITLSHRFVTLRKLKRMSQEDLARKSGVPQGTISVIELYERSHVEYSLEKAEVLAQALGFELWQLVLPIPDNLNLRDPENTGLPEFRRMMNRLAQFVWTISEMDDENQRRLLIVAQEMLNDQAEIHISREKYFPRLTKKDDIPKKPITYERQVREHR